MIEKDLTSEIANIFSDSSKIPNKDVKVIEIVNMRNILLSKDGKINAVTKQIITANRILKIEVSYGCN